MNPGTFNFWIDRNTCPDAFTPGTRCRWATFQLNGETCVVCSDGPTLTATLRLGTPGPIRLFRVPFSPSLTRRHQVTIGWSKGRMKVLLDAKQIAEVKLALPEPQDATEKRTDLPLRAAAGSPGIVARHVSIARARPSRRAPAGRIWRWFRASFRRARSSVRDDRRRAVGCPTWRAARCGSCH